MNPRLLFLAYYFPPIDAIASVRSGAIAEYLAAMGWQVTVVAPTAGVFRKIERRAHPGYTDRSNVVRMAYTDHRWRFLEPVALTCADHGVTWAVQGVARRLLRACGISPSIGWRAPARRTCEEVAARGVDLVLATGGPRDTFVVASWVARRFRIPFVLDYRDLWHGNPHLGRVASTWQKHQERAIVRDAAAITVVAPSMREFLDRQFGVGSKTTVIYNSFEPREVERVVGAPSDHFAIVYAGIFYPPASTIDPLFRALRVLDAMGGLPPWAFHYYGPQGDYVAARARRYALSHRVQLHGRVPRSEALRALKGAGVAVVISSVASRPSLVEQGIITGKIFDLIGLGVPSLIIAPEPSDIRAVVAEVGLGKAICPSEPAGIAGYLRDLMHGKTPRPGDREKYSWPRMARRLDQVLRASLCSEPPANVVAGRADLVCRGPQ